MLLWLGVCRRNVVADLVTVFPDPGFFKGVGLEGGWYIGIAESVEHVAKMLRFENWNHSENRFTRDTTNAPQS